MRFCRGDIFLTDFSSGLLFEVTKDNIITLEPISFFVRFSDFNKYYSDMRVHLRVFRYRGIFYHKELDNLKDSIINKFCLLDRKIYVPLKFLSILKDQYPFYVNSLKDLEEYLFQNPNFIFVYSSRK